MRMILVLMASLMLAMPAFADQGGEGDNTGCNGQGNPNSPCDGGAGGGGNGGGNGGGEGGSQIHTTLFESRCLELVNIIMPL